MSHLMAAFLYLVLALFSAAAGVAMCLGGFWDFGFCFIALGAALGFAANSLGRDG